MYLMKKDDPQGTSKYPSFSEEAPPTPVPIPQGMDMNQPKSSPLDDSFDSQKPAVEAPPMPITSGVPQQQSEVVAGKKDSSKFPILMGFLVFLALAVYGFVAYLYFGNQKLKTDSQKAPDNSLSTQPTPIAVAETFQFLIENGNIKKTSSSGAEQIIINKEDYPTTGLIGFTNVIASDSQELICFWSLPPALGPALYYSDSEGVTVKLIKDKVKNCVWSNSEDKIAYINDSAEGLPVDIYLYDLEAELEKNLTNQATASGVFRRYEATSFSADDGKVLCSYEEINKGNPALENLGNCEIDIATSKVTDK